MTLQLPTSVVLPSHASAPLEHSTEGLSLGELLNVFWRHRMLAGIWMATTLVFAAIYIMSLTARYHAEATIALDTRQVQFSDVSAVVSTAGNMLDASFVRSEVAIMANPDLARQVIEDLHLDTKPEFQSPPPRLIRLASTAAGILNTCCGPLHPVAAWLQHFRTSYVAKPLDAESQRAATLSAYRRDLDVSNDGRSYIITLGFTLPNPELAKQIVDRHAQLYIESQRRAKDRTLETATAWLDREVVQLGSRLGHAEVALQDYRDQHNLFGPNVEPVLQQQLVAATTQLSLAQAELTQRSARLHASRGVNSSSSMGELTGSDALNRLRESEVTARNRLTEATGRFGEAFPTVAPLRAELAQIQSAIKEKQQNIVRGIATEQDVTLQRQDALQRAVSDLQHRVATAQREQIGAQQLEREVSAQRALYESLLGRQKQVATQAGIQQADAYIVSLAELPRQPSSPNRSLFFAVALMLSGASALGIAFLLDRRQHNAFGQLDVEFATGLSSLAAIPRVENRIQTDRLVLVDMVSDSPRSAAAESVRKLRNMIAFHGGSERRAIAVTSFLPGDGKTSVAWALARSLASSDRRVLLIEADLHRRSIAKMVGLGSAAIGLVSVLTGKSELRDAVITDHEPGLDILAAETAVRVPQDLLLPQRFHRLIDAAKRSYDYVVVDTPPVGIVSDALLVARCVDATMLVVGAGRTAGDDVSSALREFQAAGLVLAGVVLNSVDPAAGLLPVLQNRGYRSAMTAYLEA